MLDAKELDKVAKLAKLKIPDLEKETFLAKLNSVFDWIEQLSKIDTSEIDVNNLTESGNTPERKDIPSRNNTREELLSNTKHKKFDMFCVPKIVE
ncbi:MAG: Asp-tRNA(Asn)/Glu-tRNA(Gln) amidotransferase subunit GatC [Holosporales bacterium]|jgi:aspartyl-tRNA(Asn)/glutamyl-tRNA(Gln) amidotransferase subunit C|nr:Asp-tRNA(Asn)/Glu-tRNA(Gln) amidotransferase subunit GatC [Holosporales bacterium]